MVNVTSGPGWIASSMTAPFETIEYQIVLARINGDIERADALQRLIAATNTPANQDAVATQIAERISTAGGGISGQVVNLTNLRLINVADSGTANTEFSFTHNLGYTPRFALLLATSVSGNLYDNSSDTATTAWTATTGAAVFSGANANLWLGVI